MTYPPQQPGPYGGQPPGPYGQQPGPYGGQEPYGQPPPQDPYGQQPTSYQGLGTYPTGPSEPPPPKKSNTGTIVAIVLVALLVLGGGGTAVFLLTKKKDEPSNSASGNQTSQTTSPKASDDTTSPSDETSTSSTPPTKRATSPADVQQAYIEAYERKSFGSVVNSACDAYKQKFGTDTTDLEKQLAPYDIKATADGAPEVDGGNATAKIDLELTKGAEVKKPKIKIKIVKESGSWKFCGEGNA